MRQDWRPEQGFEALLEVSAVPFERLEDLTAEAEIVVRRAGEEERATALVQLKNPGLCKLEVRGPLFNHLFTALEHQDTLLVYGEGVGGSWKGPADGSLLVSLTGVDLHGYDLRYALLGVVAPGRVDPEREVEYPRADRAVVPLVVENGRARRIRVDLRRGFVVGEEIEATAGEERLSRELGDFRPLGSLWLPGRVEIRQGEITVILEYRRYAVDRQVPAERFFQGLPAGPMRQVDY
jgi:hypothetical protein